MSLHKAHNLCPIKNNSSEQKTHRRVRDFVPQWIWKWWPSVSLPRLCISVMSPCPVHYNPRQGQSPHIVPSSVSVIAALLSNYPGPRSDGSCFENWNGWRKHKSLSVPRAWLGRGEAITICVADQTYRQVSSVCSILQTHHTLTFMLTPAPIHCLNTTQSHIAPNLKIILPCAAACYPLYNPNSVRRYESGESDWLRYLPISARCKSRLNWSNYPIKISLVAASVHF